MPNKSDSAGKLHQFYTCHYLNTLFPDANSSSPLFDEDERNIHLSLFLDSEKKSLRFIGELTANKIKQLIDKEIIEISDIGVVSGVIGHENTDDLLVKTDDKIKYAFSLKCFKERSQILSKNMGANSLIRDYFGSEEFQRKFNVKFNELYLEFFENVTGKKFYNVKDAKSYIRLISKKYKKDKARFTDEHFPNANQSRTKFLNDLRNELLNVINVLGKDKIAGACNLILDVDKNHLLAKYKKGKESVEFVLIKAKTEEDIKEVRVRGNDSVEILTDNYKVGFRYKFESGINSSIKLVGDYKRI